MNKSTFFSDRFPSVNCTRYAVMFSFENIYGLFRLNGNTQYSDSRSYDLILCDFHNNISPEDVLIDLFLLSSTGKIKILINDVVCIRINGQLFCYRYIKPVRSFTHFNANDSFILVPGFLSEELEDYMTQIHASEHVLSVLDGKLLSLNDEKINNLFMFCIENEVSYMPNGALSFGFSVYCFQDHNIVNIDPGETPFLSLNNAFYYYKRSCGLTSNSILLYNRYELEMVKDHCDLLFLSRIG